MSAETALATETIYVHLLDEGIDVWRPVEAVPLGRGLYRLPRNPDPEAETWEFEACEVVAERQNLSQGPAMVVVGQAGAALVEPRTAARR